MEIDGFGRYIENKGNFLGGHSSGNKEDDILFTRSELRLSRWRCDEDVHLSTVNSRKMLLPALYNVPDSAYKLLPEYHKFYRHPVVECAFTC